MKKTYYSEFYPNESADGVEGTAVPALSRTRIQDILENLGSIVADSILSKDEKIRVLIPRFTELFKNYESLVTVVDNVNGPAVVGEDPTIDKTEAVAAYETFTEYLALLEPVWDDITKDTPLLEGPPLELEGDPEPARLYFLRLFTEFVNELYDLETLLNTVYIDNIVALANDNILTPNEKLGLKLEYERLKNEKGALSTEATSYSLDTTALDTAFNTLDTYLPALLDDRTKPSDIDGDQLVADFKAYYEAAKDIREAISNAVSASGFVGYLTNENSAVAANSDGTITGDLGAAGGTFKVLFGIADISDSAVFSVITSTGVDVSISTSGVYTVNSLTADVGTAVLRATLDTLYIDKVFTISKSKAGSDGVGAKLLTLVSDRQAISFTAGVATPIDQTVTFTAQKQNTTAVVDWTINGAPSAYLSGSGDSRTLTVAQFNAARGSDNSILVAASITEGGVTIFDKISIVRIANGTNGVDGVNGDDGLQGPPGQTKYTWIAYADNSDGTVGFTVGSGVGKSYIGIANNKDTSEEGTNPIDYTWSLIRGTQGVRGTDGINGQPTYTWFAYADSFNGAVNFTTGDPGDRLYIGILPNQPTEVETTDYTRYAWTRLRGADGVDGQNGGPGIQGPRGEDGLIKYTWVAYADNADGTVGFTTASGSNKKYIGIANNKNSEAEGTNPIDYTWSLIRGTDGVPGTTGYTWFAYADSFDGAVNFTTGVPGTRTFIGIAPNKPDAAESTIYQDYTWSKLTGDTGPQGPQGTSALTAFLTNESHTFPADINGNITDGNGGGGNMRVFLGTTDITSQCTFSISGYLHIVATIQTDGLYYINSFSAAGDAGFVDFVATYQGSSITKRYSASKSRQGAGGSPGATGASAKIVTLSSTLQTFSYTAAGAPQGAGVASLVTTKQNLSPAIQWVVMDGNGNYWAVGQHLTVSGDTATISEAQFNVGRNNTNMVTIQAFVDDGVRYLDRVSIVRVQDGIQGPQGPQGPTGNTGATGGQGPGGAPGRNAIVYNQDVDPTGQITGDTWYRPTYKEWYQWNGGAWIRMLGELSAFNTVTADRISVTSLAAISANLGTFTSIVPGVGSTTITGSLITIRGPSNELRVELGIF